MMDGLVLRVMSGGGGGVGFALVNELPVNVGAMLCYVRVRYVIMPVGIVLAAVLQCTLLRYIGGGG